MAVMDFRACYFEEAIFICPFEIVIARQAAARIAAIRLRCGLPLILIPIRVHIFKNQTTEEEMALPFPGHIAFSGGNAFKNRVF